MTTRSEWVDGALTFNGDCPVNFTGGVKVGGVQLAGAPVCGMHTVTSDEATANAADITTGLTTVSHFAARVLRAGVDVTEDGAVTESGGTISVADGAATLDLTAADVIHWQATGS
ncbi:MAG: hypothetical protein GY851_09915 [bacterium]|nr:hypothetical protein [bacterium]